jgi:uncharacterized membrane protein
MRKVLYFSAAAFFMVIVSCTKKASPAKPVNEAMPARVAALSYAGSVKALIQSKCAPCHVEGGKKILLDNYDNAQKYIDNIIARVQLAPTERGFMPMRNPALSADEIALLKKWKSEGTAK